MAKDKNKKKKKSGGIKGLLGIGIIAAAIYGLSQCGNGWGLFPGGNGGGNGDGSSIGDKIEGTAGEIIDKTGEVIDKVGEVVGEVTETLVPSGNATATPVPTETTAPENTTAPVTTVAPTVTVKPTVTVAPTATSVPLLTDTPIPTPTNTVTPLPTDTPTPIPTNTSIPTPTFTPTPIPEKTEFNVTIVNDKIYLDDVEMEGTTQLQNALELNILKLQEKNLTLVLTIDDRRASYRTTKDVDGVADYLKIKYSIPVNRL